MKITFYGYNTFVVKTKDKKILIDPGGGLYFFKGWLKSLLPPSEWDDITHIFVTHGDPDHYWYADRVARKSGASLICNHTMVKEIDGKPLLLGPRDRGLAFTAEVDNLHTLAPFETIKVDGMEITGVKTAHGPLTIKLGPFSKTVKPGPKERIGWGSIGFEIRLEERVIINLGDTLIHRNEWETINSPDILMIPIGGGKAQNTMGEEDALETVEMLNPKLVIPCHYNCSAFHKKNANPADENYFYDEVRKMGVNCVLMGINESIEI